jgi:hypothetical protein
MKKVDRAELLGLAEYEPLREHFRKRVIASKRVRRVELGRHMSLVFENHDTVLLQIQEMLRTERITDERAIAHELETYNELIPPPGGLCATMFIEYDDPAQRKVMLEKFASLRRQLHLWIGDRKFTARFATHFGEEMDRLPAVNYLSFEVGVDAAAALRDPSTPASFEIDHPDYRVALDLTPALRAELISDLGS